MMTKSISFEDFLPILWAISQADEPGAYEDFLEGLKVKFESKSRLIEIFCSKSSDQNLQFADGIFPKYKVTWKMANFLSLTFLTSFDTPFVNTLEVWVDSDCVIETIDLKNKYAGIETHDFGDHAVPQ